MAGTNISEVENGKFITQLLQSGEEVLQVKFFLIARNIQIN